MSGGNDSNASSGSAGFKNYVLSLKYEHLVAGVAGGVTSTLVLHPLDLIKIRFAVDDGQQTRWRPQYRGLGHALYTIARTEGVRGLYRGVTPNVWGAGSAWGLYFMFYGSLKSWMQQGDASQQLSADRHLAAAAQSGVATLAITNPIWVVKTRLCLQYASDVSLPENQRYSGMLDALRKTYRHEGVRGLYKGFVPGIWGVSHGAIQFAVYEELKSLANRSRSRAAHAKLSTLEYLGCAALSKLVAAATTYPYQVVRARLQDQRGLYTSALRCLSTVAREEGVRGLYKGLLPSLVRVVPATGITFVVYETVNGWLNPATS